ncbi:hypothetical protein CRE_02273 [Caenorhabditis remanei]|uniref:Decapping nuclease n=1 Tax=Caenorhabditis remanei TaxID=31234 RepID=E3LG03_CAERE|nr:hypothetical protein CRE_02273 [Caenorhabditis remanei]
MAHAPRNMGSRAGARNRRSVDVEARIVQSGNFEYTSHNDEVTPGGGGRPMLIERMIHQKNVSIDVMDGYDKNVNSTLNHHSIYHLYEYEAQTMFLDSLIPSLFGFYEIQTRFLCCRYVICDIDDWMGRRKSIELLAIRKNGDIYIGSNKNMDGLVFLQLSNIVFHNSRRNDTEENNAAAFGGLNFAKKVTKEIFPSTFHKHHSVVKHWCIENHRFHRKMNVFISSVARAFDSSGNVVELKTVSSNSMGKVQNLSRTKARMWWLRALLSGANRIVYGLRMDNLIVNEILEASIDEFTKGHFRFSEADLFSEVFKIFEKIDRTIIEEESMCLVSSFFQFQD